MISLDSLQTLIEASKATSHNAMILSWIALALSTINVAYRVIRYWPRKK